MTNRTPELAVDVSNKMYLFLSQINDACLANNIFVSNSWSDPPAR
jgi:hypothetical protein